MKNHSKPHLNRISNTLPVSLWLETLNKLTFKNLTQIVSPLKRFVKHLNHIIINHLRTVSFKSKFLRFNFSVLDTVSYTVSLRTIRRGEPQHFLELRSKSLGNPCGCPFSPLLRKKIAEELRNDKSRSF
jgi:hypothetical protein